MYHTAYFRTFIGPQLKIYLDKNLNMEVITSHFLSYESGMAVAGIMILVKDNKDQFKLQVC